MAIMRHKSSSKKQSAKHMGAKHELVLRSDTFIDIFVCVSGTHGGPAVLEIGAGWTTPLGGSSGGPGGLEGGAWAASPAGTPKQAKNANAVFLPKFLRRKRQKPLKRCIYIFGTFDRLVFKPFTFQPGFPRSRRLCPLLPLGVAAPGSCWLVKKVLDPRRFSRTREKVDRPDPSTHRLGWHPGGGEGAQRDPHLGG